MTDAHPDAIRCMLIPLQEKLLLIPNTTVLEVVHFPPTTPADNTPSYWIGYADWRSQQVPVIDLDALLEQHAATAQNASHLCILKGIHDADALSAYAIPCYAPPQLISIDEETLQNLEQADDDLLYGQFKIGSKTAFIPNIDELEVIITSSAAST